MILKGTRVYDCIAYSLFHIAENCSTIRSIICQITRTSGPLLPFIHKVEKLYVSIKDNRVILDRMRVT